MRPDRHVAWLPAEMPVAAMAAAMGGNVRVGLEDSLCIGTGQLAASNARQVTQVRKIIEGLGLEIAPRPRRATSCNSRAATRSASDVHAGRVYGKELALILAVLRQHL